MAKETALDIAQPTPMSVLQMAVQQGADVEKLAQLLALQERWEANEARKAYVRALNTFKANAPQILKNRHVKFGNTEYDHATLDNVTEILIRALNTVGISHSWKTQSEAGKVRVTCVLTHELGHTAEEATLEAAPDASGGKNGIQAIGSTVTYLERYTLLAACGLSTKGADNDGAALLEDRVAEQLEWIANAKDLAELQKLFKAAYSEAALLKDKSAMSAYIEAKDNRKADLS